MSTPCPCVADHRPKPLRLHSWIVWLPPPRQTPPREVLFVCAVAHENLTAALGMFFDHEGEPPWSEQLRFSPWVRRTAWRTYMSRKQGRLVE